MVWGLAAKPNIWFTVPTTRLDTGEKGESRLLYVPGCFDRFFDRLRAGKRTIHLMIDHKDGSELCSTDDSLRVWQDSDGAIRFKVDPSTRAGRKAIEFARRNPDYRQASLAASYSAELPDDPDAMITTALTSAEIIEISLVCQGSFPGTFVCVE
jgi:hypothetical protein